MRIACISDTHGFLPNVPKCDLVLVGGDICPDFRDSSDSILAQVHWLDTEFRNWLNNSPPMIAVAGNHDKAFQQAPHLIPNLPWTYLQDNVTKIHELTVFGSPWQKPFGWGWAFNLDTAGRMRRWANMPDNADIVLTHSPAFGIGDLVPEHGHQGCEQLRLRLYDVKPKLFVHGHIHQGYGTYVVDGTICVNASFSRHRNTIQVIDIDT